MIAKSFMSGTTKIFISTEKNEIYYADLATHRAGEGLPEGFTLTETAMKEIGEYINEKIPYFPYENFYDKEEDTLTTLMPGWGIVEAHYSKKGNIVLDADLMNPKAFYWLVAQVFDAGYAEPTFPHFTAKNIQYGNE